MEPSQAELLTITDITGVFQWLELDTEVAAAITHTMGATNTLRSWARIPETRYAAALATVRVGVGEAARELTPAEEGQGGTLGASLAWRSWPRQRPRALHRPPGRVRSKRSQVVLRQPRLERKSSSPLCSTKGTTRRSNRWT